MEQKYFSLIFDNSGRLDPEMVQACIDKVVEHQKNQKNVDIFGQKLHNYPIKTKRKNKKID